MNNKLKALRGAMAGKALDAYIIPMPDRFQSEFVPEPERRLEWLTEFTGSNGLAIVTAEQAAFFTDGRYVLQAESEVPAEYTRYNMAEQSPWEWLAGQCATGSAVGYDPWLVTQRSLGQIEEALDGSGAALKALDNLIDPLWENRPVAEPAPAFIHEIKYSGQETENKVINIIDILSKKQLDGVYLTLPESVCWLLNIRGADLPYTPFLLSFAYVSAQGEVALYTDARKLQGQVAAYLTSHHVTVRPVDAILTDAGKQTGKIGVDPATTPSCLFSALKNANLTAMADPCLLPKACKNVVEVAGMQSAHERDGAALCSFLCWLESEIAAGGTVTEHSAAERLRGFREQQPLFFSPSFETISGYAAHGAIVHYRVDETTDSKIKPGSLYLLDSGGQYYDGTTDVTRTLAIGVPTAEQKRHFTLVLKGHIALAMAVFPQGTTGAALDILARQFLWQDGLDYDHGTGHGVGSFLNVHEGPQGISKRANSTALMPGMIISNEPGFYLKDAYGIRIENLVVVEEAPGKQGYLHFHTLTLTPIDLPLVDVAMLTEEEKHWLNQYHQRVYDRIAPQVDNSVQEWLKRHIATIA